MSKAADILCKRIDNVVGTATVILHPAFQWRMSLHEFCNFIGCYGYVLCNQRGKSGRSWLVLSRAKDSL